MRLLVFLIPALCFAQTDIPGPVAALPASGAPTSIAVWNTAQTFKAGFTADGSLSANLLWKLPTADGTSGQALTTNGSKVLSWSTVSNPPFIDTTNIIKGSADATKLLRFEVDGFTAATTRTLTPQDASYTIAGTDISNTFSVNQTMSADILFNADATRSIGTSSARALGIFSQTFQTSDSSSTAGCILGGNPVIPGINCYAGGGANTLLFLAATGSLTLPILGVASNRCVHADSGGLLGVASADCGTGTVTSISTTSPITGGTITSTGTIACATCLTTNTSQTITGVKNFQADATYDADATYSLGSISKRALGIFSQTFQTSDSSSTAGCILGGNPVIPGINCYSGGGANTLLFLAATGSLTLPALGVASNRCIHADSSGLLGVAAADCGTGTGTVTSISTTSPITGGTITTTGTIACATCLTTNTSQTITGVKNFQADATYNADATYSLGTASSRALGIFSQTFQTSNSGSAAGCILGGNPVIPGINCYAAGGANTLLFLAATGSLTLPALGVATNRCVHASSAGLLGVAGQDCGDMFLAASQSFTGTLSVTTGSIIVGSSGNFYTRPISGNSISCSGVTDGWMAWNTAGQELLMCAGNNRYKVSLASY